MSYTDYAAARRVKGLRGTTQAVFYEIAFRTTNDDSLHECSVKVATLAEALGKADQAIRMAIKELKCANLIQTTRRMRQNGTRSCFKFKLIMPFPPSVIVPKRVSGKPQPAVISTPQPTMISTALLSGSSLDQGFIQKIEAAATPSPFPATKDSEAEKTPEKNATGIEPPYCAYSPIDSVVNRYRKKPTPTAFLACMHELRTHLGFKTIKTFPKADYTHVPELFDLLGSPSQAFDVLADFARACATTTANRPHFGPKQVLLHYATSNTVVDVANCKKPAADPCDDIKPYVVGEF
jgi:hypothetical protein